jgi:integrase
MASYQKIGSKWQARIRRAGFPSKSENFNSKAEAKAWAIKTEAAMISLKYQDVRVVAKTTIRTLIERYEKDIGAVKPFGKNKTAVLKTLKRDLGDVLVPHLNVDRLTTYIKDRQMAGAGGVTIGIDLTYLKTVLKTARQLWRLPIDLEIISHARANMSYYDLSTKSDERDRRPTGDELKRLKEHFTNKTRQKLPMADLIDFAAATAMRSGEITRILWDDVDEEHKTVIIRDRKDPRAKKGNDQSVPLLPDAWKILMAQPKTSDRIFPWNEKTISSIFPRAVHALGIEDLHFHDLRHEGTSRLFEDGYRIEEVAVFTGHKDWKQLKRYTHIKAKNLHKDRHGNERRRVLETV